MTAKYELFKVEPCLYHDGENRTECPARAESQCSPTCNGDGSRRVRSAIFVQQRVYLRDEKPVPMKAYRAARRALTEDTPQADKEKP